MPGGASPAGSWVVEATTILILPGPTITGCYSTREHMRGREYWSCTASSACLDQIG